jgi:hypothetical protein
MRENIKNIFQARHVHLHRSFCLSTYSSYFYHKFIGRSLLKLNNRIFIRVFDWMIGFIDTLYKVLGSTGNYSAIAIYTLYSSSLHTHQGSQSSLVVSWQRIYNSLTVTSNNTWSLLFTSQLISFAIILQLPISKTQLNSVSLLPGSYPDRLASQNSTRQNSSL